MSNPFEILGVSHEDAADPEKLRRAWLAAIKVAHTDASGSDDHGPAAAVNAAYEALQDPVLRSAAAEVGDLSSLNSLRMDAHQLLVNLVLDAITGTDGWTGQPRSPDAVRTHIRRGVTQLRQEANSAIRQMTRRRDDLANALRRLTFKGNGPDTVSTAATNTLDGLDASIRVARGKRWIAGEVERLAADYDFAAVPDPPASDGTERTRMLIFG